MWFSSLLGQDRPRSNRATSPRKRRLAKTRLSVESLEARRVPTANLSASLVANVVPDAGFPGSIAHVSGSSPCADCTGETLSLLAEGVGTITRMQQKHRTLVASGVAEGLGEWSLVLDIKLNGDGTSSARGT